MSQNQYESLNPWGWSPVWSEPYEEAVALCPRGVVPVPARVIGREGPVHLLETPDGPRAGLVSGRLQFTGTEADFPLVGDWVVAQLIDSGQAVIHGVVARKTVFSRSVSTGSPDGSGRQSFLAANLDVLGIVMGLDGNFNPRRAQRLATLARHGGMLPLWILSKADLADSGAKVETARTAAGEDPLVVLSALAGTGLEALDSWLTAGTAIALAGSSGVGKTTLVNRLLSSSLATREVRTLDSKGKHTTTSRHLYQLPSGALLMDAPGFRTVGLWADADDLAEGFSDIEALAALCRFHDCRHQEEPGCAVREALAEGSLDEARWEGWRRQERELHHLAKRDNKALQRAEKDRWKAIHQQMRNFNKRR